MQIRGHHLTFKHHDFMLLVHYVMGLDSNISIFDFWTGICRCSGYNSYDSPISGTFSKESSH